MTPVPTAADAAHADAVVAGMRGPGPATAELVNDYYTLCIPFYREFLGNHWHTGFYVAGEEPSPADQLRMELVVAHSAGLEPGCEVLDVGCGMGGPACHIAWATGARVTGLTPNATQLKLARELAARHIPPVAVTFDEGSAMQLPYPDDTFDVVLFFESACHFPDRAQFFREAFRVLRPGGRLAGQDWMRAEAGDPLLAAQVCSTWAIPALDTIAGYTAGMRAAGFDVRLAHDMRNEMDVLRGFMSTPEQRAEVVVEIPSTASSIRRMIMEGLMVLGEAAEKNAFTIGRFLARKSA